MLFLSLPSSGDPSANGDGEGLRGVHAVLGKAACGTQAEMHMGSLQDPNWFRHFDAVSFL